MDETLQQMQVQASFRPNQKLHICNETFPFNVKTKNINRCCSCSISILLQIEQDGVDPAANAVSAAPPEIDYDDEVNDTSYVPEK